MTTHKKHFELNTDSIKIIVMALLALNLIFSVYVAFFKKDALWLETLKSGGSENFALVQQLYNNETYKSQQTQTLKQVLGSMGAETPKTDDAAKVLETSVVEKLLKDTLIQGKQDARFVILEYSDLLCPFCKRHYEAQTLEKIVKKYPNDVSLIFKSMPLVQLHPTSFKGSEGLECAGKIGGTDAFYKYLGKAFKAESFDDTNVVDMAKEIGLNTTKFTSCVNNGETQEKINGILQEASNTFGINGTPGNVIIDRQTGKYTIINGAYPFEKFDEEIQNLMK